MDGHDQLVEQIVRLLDIRLFDPLELLLDGDDVVDAVRALVRVRAGRWVDEMLHAGDTAAVGRAAQLISTIYPGDRAFDPPAEWWHTPLGRTMARRVGHPAAESVSYATAGAMLGISRQGVHDLVRRGRLPRHPEGGVPSAAVRDRLRAGPSPGDEPPTAEPLPSRARQPGLDSPGLDSPVLDSPVTRNPVPPPSSTDDDSGVTS